MTILDRWYSCSHLVVAKTDVSAMDLLIGRVVNLPWSYGPNGGFEVDVMVRTAETVSISAWKIFLRDREGVRGKFMRAGQQYRFLTVPERRKFWQLYGVSHGILSEEMLCAIGDVPGELVLQTEERPSLQGGVQ